MTGGSPARDRLLDHPVIARLAGALDSHAGTYAEVAPDVRRAAVGLVLAPDDAGDPSLLFIKRAEYAGDPWSGQVAFPGGRHEPDDESLAVTAMRETWEETGMDLTSARLLGTLDELHPRTPVLPPIVVRPYVFVAPPAGPLTLSSEVAAAFWAPLAALLLPESSFEATVQVRQEERRVPAIRHAEYTIWGMTEQILRQLFARLR